MKINNQYFLYTGLILLFIAIASKITGVSHLIWLPVFILAILLKSIFLINIFRRPDFKFSLPLLLILMGVVLILMSMLFQTIFPIPLLRNILFGIAIALKISGLALILFKKKGRY